MLLAKQEACSSIPVDQYPRDYWFTRFSKLSNCPEDAHILIPELCEWVPAGGSQHASSALKLKNSQTEGQTRNAQLDR